MSLDDAVKLADETLAELKATADVLTIVLTDEAIDRDDVYLAACERLGLTLIPAERVDGACIACGGTFDTLHWPTHARWHLRVQAAVRFAQHQAGLSAKTTVVLGAFLLELFRPEEP